MKRACSLALVLLAAGCGKVGESTRVGPGGGQRQGLHAGAEAQAPEEFDGLVELFGKKVRAQRQVMIDADGDYVRQGKSVAWYESGQKAGEMWYQNNKPNGPEFAWHENGKKKLRGQSKDGLAMGKWVQWYDNGQLESEGEYYDGERNGMWTFWEPTGQVKETIEYRFGTKVNVAKNPSLEVPR